MKKISILILLLFSLSMAPMISSAACPTPVSWDGVELKSGQIGRVLIQKPTTIYKNVHGTFEFSRTVQPGENYRVYANRSTYYHLGGGLVIKEDSSILYQTPSKHKLTCTKNASSSFTIGDSATSVATKLGIAQKKVINEFGTSTSLYHQNYQNFYAISFLNNKISSLYTKDKHYQVDGISVTNTISDLEWGCVYPLFR